MPPASRSAVRIRPEAAVQRFHRRDRRRDAAGVPDHVRVREVADDDLVPARDSMSATSCVGDAVGAHLRHQIVGRNLLRRHQDAILALVRLLPAAVEKVGDVRVLLGLGEPQIGAPVRFEDVGEVAAEVCGSNTTGNGNVRSYTVIVVAWTRGTDPARSKPSKSSSASARVICRMRSARKLKNTTESPSRIGARALPSASVSTTGLMNSSVTPAVVRRPHWRRPPMSRWRRRAADDRVLRELRPFPPLVAVHRVVATDDRGDSAGPRRASSASSSPTYRTPPVGEVSRPSVMA